MAAERPRFEVADVARAHGDELLRKRRMSASQRRTLRNVAACRTATLGGHLDECADACGYARVSYNSCRDRHCPKCQGRRRAEWIAKRIERLLPVPHFHVVFTVPAALNAIALRNKAVVYDALFEAASESLLQLARDPRRLGAQVGVTAVLHTWGQNLLLHPHIHCVVTGGGLSPDGERWISGRDRYFLPVKPLARLFRGKLLAALGRARRDGALEFAGSTAEYADPVAWAGLRDRLHRVDWVVYAKPPFGGAETVVRYLGRYTHRVAISNSRIVGFADGRVAFSLKDYRDGGRRKAMTLDADEFLRRFLLHVLPRGFVRIRHYGLCASRNVNTKLAAARRLLHPGAPVDPAPPAEPAVPTPWWERLLRDTGVDFMACPACGGRLHRRGPIPPAPSPPARAPPAAA